MNKNKREATDYSLISRHLYIRSGQTSNEDLKQTSTSESWHIFSSLCSIDKQNDYINIIWWSTNWMKEQVNIWGIPFHHNPNFGKQTIAVEFCFMYSSSIIEQRDEKQLFPKSSFWNDQAVVFNLETRQVKSSRAQNYTERWLVSKSLQTRSVWTVGLFYCSFTDGMNRYSDVKGTRHITNVISVHVCKQDKPLRSHYLVTEIWIN